MNHPSPARAAQQARTHLARQLVDPASTSHHIGQSLSRGAAGIALWHLERAYHDEPGARENTHAWVRAALAEPVSSADPAGLFAGLPAIAYLLHLAEPVIGDYRPTLDQADAHLIRLTHHRVDTALARINRSELTSFAEYDLVRGLTGIGQLLLTFLPGNDALERILHYLVRLTEPLRIDGETMPGWWVGHHPDPILPTPGGHTNLGLAHGIAGPLALLASAMRANITVDGHREAIDRLHAHLDQWRQESTSGSWWPYWINRSDHARGRIEQTGPGRPSWCYGPPGITRAQQLAALATGDARRQHDAEAALAACLSDPDQLALITESGLCHGSAGLYHTAARAAADANNPAIAHRLPQLATLLTQHATTQQPPEDGFLDGTTGTTLTLNTLARSSTPTPPRSGWDTCLLITRHRPSQPPQQTP